MKYTFIMNWNFSYQKVSVFMFVLFAVVMGIFLHRIPGLMGDEASEGENVYELLSLETITVTGERSYIGPVNDYVRVPFVWLFGYSVLGVRVPMYLFSLAGFWLALLSLRKLFGEHLSLYVMAFYSFSLPFLSFQRLGWAITLFPFFAWLIVYLLLSEYRYKYLLAGLVAGLGLANHVIFLPTLVAIACIWLVAMIVTRRAELVRAWPALIGFWAGFGMQFVVLLTETSDQGDPSLVAKTMFDRFSDLSALLPLLVSGSSYVARYTGAEFSPLVALGVTGLVGAFALMSLFAVRKYSVVTLLVLGIFIQMFVLLYMIDRFTLRYFAMPVYWLYLLAGIGFGAVLEWVFSRLKMSAHYLPPLVISIGFACMLFWLVIIPFAVNGGSVNDFSLGNRTNSAKDLADTRGLITCLEGVENVSSDNIHIFNRLQYLSHSNSRLSILPQEEYKSSVYEVIYRDGKTKGVEDLPELCQALRNFMVIPNRSRSLE